MTRRVLRIEEARHVATGLHSRFTRRITNATRSVLLCDRILAGFCLLVVCLAACVPTAEQQAAAFTPTASTLDNRTRQSRRFDTTDTNLMLQSSVGALQDLGFTIEETQAAHGVIVASKNSGGQIRAQVTLVTVSSGIIVRAIFQHIIPRPGAMLAVGETLTYPVLYQGFFEKLSQSAFLTAHDI